MNKIFFLLLMVFSFNSSAITVVKADAQALDKLDRLFQMDAKTPGLMQMLKKQTFAHKQNAVPVLIKVMKDGKAYPEGNRWHATMLLAQVMGKKSAPFIAKFADHPHWMMRLASLKALLGLQQREYHAVYSKALRDPSLIVRIQALDNISKMNINPLGHDVWKMMFDQSNYVGAVGKRKRSSIVKSIIRTLGDVKYTQAKKPLAKLIQKPKYQDLANELNYSLEKMTGEHSPAPLEARKKFWAKHAQASI